MKPAPQLIALVASIAITASCVSVHRAPLVDLNRSVPDSFLVTFETTRGRFDVMARKQWAPDGVDRFHSLVESRYYDGAAFFRVVKNFVAQFGLASDPAITAAWRPRAIADEPVKHPNARGTIAYARGGPGTRSIQLYINLKDNARLDTLNGFGFPPIADVVSGMSTVDSLYSGYGNSPSQDSIGRQGNDYLRRAWPKLDYVKRARIVREWSGSANR